MKTPIVLLVICILCRPGILTKVTFLQIPKLLQVHQTREPFKFEDNELQSNEDVEEDNLNSYIDEIITKEELEELRDAVSVFDDYDVYDGIYDPFSNVTQRKKRSLGDNLAKQLSGIVENFDKMLESSNKTVQENHYNKAVDMLDNYISAVKQTKDAAKENALQIFKQEQYNLILVNCGGWLWYPVKKVQKIITCKNGYMRFERRYQEKVQVCDDFVCKRVKM